MPLSQRLSHREPCEVWLRYIVRVDNPNCGLHINSSLDIKLLYRRRTTYSNVETVGVDPMDHGENIEQG